jgi:hypothetical protein
MKPDEVGSYHDAGGIRHDVLVRETRGGDRPRLPDDHRAHEPSRGAGAERGHT